MFRLVLSCTTTGYKGRTKMPPKQSMYYNLFRPLGPGEDLHIFGVSFRKKLSLRLEINLFFRTDDICGPVGPKFDEIILPVWREFIIDARDKDLTLSYCELKKRFCAKKINKSEQVLSKVKLCLLFRLCFPYSFDPNHHQHIRAGTF